MRFAAGAGRRPTRRDAAGPVRRRDEGPPDRGSAVAEFALVSVMVVLLFLSIIQVCLWIYTRNVLASATADVARYAGLADVTNFDVTNKVADRLGDGLATGTKTTLTCTRSQTPLMSEVRCTLRTPGLIGLLDGIMPDVTTTAHAAREGVT